MSRINLDDDFLSFDDPRGGRLSNSRVRRKLHDEIERSSSAAYQPTSHETSLVDEVKCAKIKSTVDEAFQQSQDVITRLDAMLQLSEQSLSKAGFSLDVDRKMNTYKSVLENQGQESLFSVLLGDIVAAMKVAKANEILSKDNAELLAQVQFARDVASRKQRECVATLKDMVYQAVELADKKENEALDWKKKHDLLVIQSNVHNNKVNALEKQLLIEKQKFEDLSKEERILQNKIDHSSLELEDKESKLKQLSSEASILKEKVQELSKKNDQLTEEIVHLDSELRKKNECISSISSRYETRVNEIYQSTEKKANEHIQVTVTSLEEKHQQEVKDLNQKIEHLQNEKEMGVRKIDDLSCRIEELTKKYTQLRANAIQSERYAKAKCLRKVMTAITDNVSDSGSEISDVFLSVVGRGSENRRARTMSELSSGKRVAFDNQFSKTPSPRKKQQK